MRDPLDVGSVVHGEDFVDGGAVEVDGGERGGGAGAREAVGVGDGGDGVVAAVDLVFVTFVGEVEVIGFSDAAVEVVVGVFEDIHERAGLVLHDHLRQAVPVIPRVLRPPVVGRIGRNPRLRDAVPLGVVIIRERRVLGQAVVAARLEAPVGPVPVVIVREILVGPAVS